MAICGMFFRGLGWLPFTLVVSACLTFVVSYIIAIVKGDVPVFFPYISDTGAHPPESCIFGQFLNIVTALGVAVIYVRYKLVTALTATGGSLRLRRLNMATLIIGICSSMGMSLVANFQESTVLVVHMIGASILFVGGTVYVLFNVILSYCMSPSYNSRRIAHIRLAFLLFSFAFIVSTYTAATVAFHKGHSDATVHFVSPWSSSDPGYTAHIVSTFSEWLLAANFLFFFLTYIRDFQKVSIVTQTNLHALHLDDEPVYTEEAAHLLMSS